MKKNIFISFISIIILFFPLVVFGVSTGDLSSPHFMIDPNDIYPGVNIPETGSENIANWILGTIIQNMMIALGAISILIMTIGAGHMILHSGQEEMLTRGKTIFMSGIYAMIIALSSYYLIAILRYLLYS